MYCAAMINVDKRAYVGAGMTICEWSLVSLLTLFASGADDLRTWQYSGDCKMVHNLIGSEQACGELEVMEHSPLSEILCWAFIQKCF